MEKADLQVSIGNWKSAYAKKYPSLKYQLQLVIKQLISEA